MTTSTLTYPEGMVRAVAPVSADNLARQPYHYRYVSIIRFANCYSVVLSNDPAGEASGHSSRLNVTQTEGLGFASRIFNAIAEGR
jgi:hypothetical protein